jgi:Cofilin/tropomyosin-type actin-binding protein
MADFGDADIHEALKSIRDLNSSTDWMLLTHKPRSDKELKLVDSGEEGWEDMCEYTNDGKVQFGFCRINLGGTFKFVYLSYCGEGVTGMKKGLFNAQAQFVGDRLFTGYHVQVNARSEEDLDITKVTGEVKKSAGASFYKTHSDQSGESAPEASSVTYESRDHDQSTTKEGEASSVTYESRDADQSTENAPDVSFLILPHLPHPSLCSTLTSD